MALVSQSEFAKRNGWTRQYVSKLVRQGRIRLENGKVNEIAALRALKADAEPSTVLREKVPEKRSLTPAVSSPAPMESRPSVDYLTARTMREAYRAKMTRMEYEQKQGKLTDAARVREDAFQAGRIVRDAILALPDRLADILAAENNPGKVHQLLRDELELALEQLSGRES